MIIFLKDGLGLTPLNINGEDITPIIQQEIMMNGSVAATMIVYYVWIWFFLISKKILELLSVSRKKFQPQFDLYTNIIE